MTKELNTKKTETKNNTPIQLDADIKAAVIDRPRPLGVFLDERKKTKCVVEVANAETAEKKKILTDLQKGLKSSIHDINNQLTEEKSPRLTVRRETVETLSSEVTKLEDKIKSLELELHNSKEELKSKVKLHSKAVSGLGKETVKVGKEIEKETAKKEKELKSNITSAKKDYKKTADKNKAIIAREKRKTFGKTTKETILFPFDALTRSTHGIFYGMKRIALVFNKTADKSYNPPSIFAVKRDEEITKKRKAKATAKQTNG